MLLGHWKNIADLEECLNLPELELIIEASRKKEEYHRRFLAGLKGINLDEGEGNVENAQEKVEEMKRRIEAKRAGKSDAEFDMDELGLEIEVEE